MCLDTHMRCMLATHTPHYRSAAGVSGDTHAPHARSAVEVLSAKAIGSTSLVTHTCAALIAAPQVCLVTHTRRMLAAPPRS